MFKLKLKNSCYSLNSQILSLIKMMKIYHTLYSVHCTYYILVQLICTQEIHSIDDDISKQNNKSPNFPFITVIYFILLIFINFKEIK